MRDNVKKVYVNAQWQGGADRSTYDGAEELRKYLPGQDYVILPVSTEEAEMAVMRNGIRDLMFYTGRCSPLTSVCGKTHQTAHQARSGGRFIATRELSGFCT